MTPADLILQHQDPMRRAAERLTRGGADADDVMQAACVNALGAKVPPDLHNPRAWLCGFVRNAWFDLCRRERRYEGGGDELAAAIPVEPSQHHAAELSEVLGRVGRLPAKEREAFMAIAVNNNTTREAARALGYRDNKGVLYQYGKARRNLGLAA